MASTSKKRTTMAKLARENKLRERRAEKQARKDARRYAAANPPLDGVGDDHVTPLGASAQPEPPAGPAEA